MNKKKEFALENIRKSVIEEAKKAAGNSKNREPDEEVEKKPKKRYDVKVLQADLPKPDYSFMDRDMTAEKYIAYMLHREIPGEKEEED